MQVPPQTAYAYKSMPASYLHLEQTGSAVLDSKSNLFPTLTKSVASVTGKMAPRIGEITAQLKVSQTGQLRERSAASGQSCQEELCAQLKGRASVGSRVCRTGNSAG